MAADPYQELIEALRHEGLVEDARWLSGVLTVAYTTSSEMYGKLGQMMSRIHRSIPVDSARRLRSLFEECSRTVKKVWPMYQL